MEKIVYGIVKNKLTHIIAFLLVLYMTSNSISSLFLYDYDIVTKPQLILGISGTLLHITCFIFVTVFYAKISLKHFIRKVKNYNS
ncbi:MAG: hypothetical protein ACI9QN_001991 [Arcticibacterium sp.]|jgi:hypothetical protein